MSTQRRLVDLDQGLVERAKAQLDLVAAGNQAAIEVAVARHLPTVISRARAAGLTERPTGRRRSRAIGDSTWEALRKAEAEAVAIDMIALLRACLVLASRERETNG